MSASTSQVKDTREAGQCVSPGELSDESRVAHAGLVINNNASGGPLPSEEGTPQQVVGTFTRTPGTNSGPACLICAEFDPQRRGGRGGGARTRCRGARAPGLGCRFQV